MQQTKQLCSWHRCIKNNTTQIQEYFCIWVKSTWVHFETRVQQNRIYFKCWIYKLDYSEHKHLVLPLQGLIKSKEKCTNVFEVRMHADDWPSWSFQDLDPDLLTPNQYGLFLSGWLRRECKNALQFACQ